MVELSFPLAAPPLNLNTREHWAPKARKTKVWRTSACFAARAAGVGPQPPSAVRVTIPFARGARRDPHNYVPTVKAIVDGLVDAGLWPDDVPQWLVTVEPRLVVDPTGVVLVAIVPQAEVASLLQ